jgi:phosphoglycolate phosphatase-like HAD superfamily hydrolase
LNVIRPSLLESVPALREADAACEASLQRVLEAYAVLIAGTSLLDQECKSVLLKLLEVFRAGTSTAEYGFEVLAMFQRLGDATFPYPHFQQMLRITSAEKVAKALRDHFDAEQVHAAVRAYCTALANYADSMAATYRAKFVPLKEALRVAQSMAVIVFDLDETLVHASDVEIESEAQLLEVTWETDTDTMRRYKKRVSEKNPAHLKLKLGGPDGDTATSRIHVSRARNDMFKRLLEGQFQSAYFASANNDGRTNALIGELRKKFEWVRRVEIIPREKFMVGDCDPRDQKKSIAAIRAAVGVPDDVVVVMVDDKAGAVVGAGARDALVAVRPFMGNDAELDAKEERSLEREIAERAAPARECKRKRDVTAE